MPYTVFRSSRVFNPLLANVGKSDIMPLYCSYTTGAKSRRIHFRWYKLDTQLTNRLFLDMEQSSAYNKPQIAALYAIIE